MEGTGTEKVKSALEGREVMTGKRADCDWGEAWGVGDGDGDGEVTAVGAVAADVEAC